MKVLLVNPPQIFYPASWFTEPQIPLGISYIAAMLEKNGYNVDILDALIADFSPRAEDGGRRYGMAWGKIKEAIQRSRPDVVGITSPNTPQIDNASRVSQIVKQLDSKILTVVGGPHVSVQPMQFLRDIGSVDIVVIGEGEYAMLDIMRYREGKKNISEILGIAYRKDGQIILNPRRAFIKNVDEIPFPAYHMLDMEEYLNPSRSKYRAGKRLREMPMITSRGCPYNCVFCSIHLHMGRKWRAHSKEYVTSHIKHVINNYGVHHIHFQDDNLTLDIERFESILDALIDEGIRFTWDTPNGVRADRLTEDLLRKMKTANCTHLQIAIESGDQCVLDSIIGKHLRLEDAVRTAQACQQLGIKLDAFYVIGFPGEKKQDMKRTIDFALRLKREYGVGMGLSVAAPYLGTKLYQICKEKGYLTQELTSRVLSESRFPTGKGLIRTEDFTPEEINRLIFRSLLLDYIRNPEETVKVLLKKPGVLLQFIKSCWG